jgi:soluble lytic murein transglycosylase-like protein
MTPPTRARRRALRAVLGTLASGGLTAAALGGPLAPGAMAGKFAEVPTTPEVTASSEPAAESVAPAEPTSTTTTPPAPTTTTGTTTAPQPATPAPQEVPAVALQRRQKTTQGAKQSPSATSTAAKKDKGQNNVAGSPQSVAKAGALAAVLASSQASVQALAFYRVPLFLLPIYKAAAVQYGVPWQILAAINEIETDYGTDQSVSSAGAVGWMQFMPETWMQYGVDALNSGYADPYNPVDAVFAAARYLRAAGAATNLRQAILAYNHSEEYVDSVMLRAKLISTYPKPVIATLTGLVDGRPPVDGKVLEWGALPSEPAAASSPTAGATATSPAAAGETAAASAASATTPGSSSAPSPTAAAASHTTNAPKLQTVELTSSAKASVVAVQDGRVMQIGDSRKIGRYIVLRDVYGDLFTYAGLGSIAPTYTVAKPSATKATSAVVETASTKDPAPAKAATAGSQTPVTLQVKTPAPQNHSGGGKALIETGEAVPAGMGRKRLFAKPGNPDAKAAAAVAGARQAAREKAAQKQPLRKGSVVSSGTVLGTVTTLKGAHAGHLRFGIRPAGDAAYIDPGPVLANWAQLQKALHPQGARAANALLGATASDVFLLSKSQLERTILSDPGITVTGCSRQDIASGVVDHRVLALLAFLSRSGLKPTVGALRCGQSQYTASGALSPHYRGDAVDISAINDVPLARHQGPGTITDLTIRALLTLPSEFVPHEILSLMHYPADASTRAESSHWNKIELVFGPATKTSSPASTTAAAHSAGKGKTAPVPVVSTSLLSPVQWTQLIGRVGAIATPKIAYKPTSSAIPDPKSK